MHCIITQKDKSKEMKTVSSQDLITAILSLLPVKSLVRFQCVSKSWFALINDPYFIKMHLNCSIKTNRERILIAQTTQHPGKPKNYLLMSYYLLNFSDDDRFSQPMEMRRPFSVSTKTAPPVVTTIVGCCNGLVCLHSFPCSVIGQNIGNPSETVIWNPLIRKYKKLPTKPIEKSDYYELELAFGYDQVNEDYKVLRILKFGLPYQVSNAKAVEVDHVYSLRGHSWRRVEDPWPYKGLKSFICSGPAWSNGALHWVVGRPKLTGTLVAFDLNTEKFRAYATPFNWCDIFAPSIDLEVLRGWLCICMFDFDKFMDVWIMKEYGVASSWTRLYTFQETDHLYCKPLVFSNDGKEVLMKNFFVKLFSCDIKDVYIKKRLNYFKKFTLLVGSLLLLDGECDH